MVKRVKDMSNSLYDFNAHDDEDNKKRKKSNKKVSKTGKTTKTSKSRKVNNDTIKKKKNAFDFSNEIVIGLKRIDEEKETKNNKKGKTVDKKKEKERKKKEKERERIRQQKVKKEKLNKKRINEQKIKKEKNKLKQNKKNRSILKERVKDRNIDNHEITIDSISQGDIILNTNNNNNKNEKKFKRTKKFFKYSTIVVAIVILIVAIMMSPLFNIKEIKTSGNEKISDEELISLSQINIGENTYRTNMTKAKKNILENPYVKEVKIKRIIPDKVLIQIEERKTKFMIEYGGGYVYISNQGYILEISDTKLEVPILQGEETVVEDFKPGNRLCKKDLEKMSTVNKIMETAENNEIDNLITRIDIENKLNYKIVFETEEKVAYLGDDSDLNTKMLSIKSILDREKDIAGEIFVNMDLKDNYPTFRQSV